MRHVKLDASGVIAKQKSPVPSKSVKPVSTVSTLADNITADFIREIKDELVQELARLLGGLSINSTASPQEKRDSFVKSDIVMKPIEIDESVVVTEVSVGQIEKGFEDLTETKISKDDNLSDSISKLRSMKKGN